MKQKIIKSILVGLFLLIQLMGSQLYAASRHLSLLESHPSSINLIPFFDVLEDKTSQLSWESIQNKKTLLVWQNLDLQTEGFNFGFTQSSYWLRLTIDNKSPLPLEKILELSKARINYVDFYQEGPDGRLNTVKTGDLLPFASRPYPSRFFVFPVKIPAYSQTVLYLRVQSEAALVLPIKLWEPSAYYKSEQLTYALQAMYVGLAIGMILLNLLIYISIKDLNYLLYVGFSTALVFSITALNGLQKEFLHFESETYFRVASPIGFSISLAFAIYFLRNMLKTWITCTKFETWLKLLAGLHLLLCLAYLTSQYLFVVPGQILNFVTIISILLVAGRAVIRKQREAYFCFVAFLILLGSGAFTAIVPLFLLPVSTVSLYALQIGSAIEMVLMSLAIADRFHMLRLDMMSAQTKILNAQEKAIENLKKSEKQLEAKVMDISLDYQTLNKSLQLSLLDLNQTQLKLTESESKVTQSEINVKKLIDEQRQFLAMVSHEFRMPLTIIDRANQLLERKIQNKPDTASILGRIKRAVSKLTHFMDNYLTQDRLDSYELTVNYGEVNLKDLISSVVDYARLISDQYSLRVELDEELSIFRADPDLLRILVFNLVSNAIKYSPVGQEIILRVYKKNNLLKIEVIDQGFGVAEKEMEHIFKTYARGRQASHVPGAGLGLSLVERITQLHGGTLEFNSTEGVGTHVVISLQFT